MAAGTPNGGRDERKDQKEEREGNPVEEHGGCLSKGMVGDSRVFFCLFVFCASCPRDGERRERTTFLEVSGIFVATRTVDRSTKYCRLL